MNLACPGAAPRARHQPARCPRPDHDHAIQVRHVLNDRDDNPENIISANPSMSHAGNMTHMTHRGIT
jgi:hypothetical protein